MNIRIKTFRSALNDYYQDPSSEERRSALYQAACALDQQIDYPHLNHTQIKIVHELLDGCFFKPSA